MAFCGVVDCLNGLYCDHGTGKCETCFSICDPLRYTKEDCLNTPACQDYWQLPKGKSQPTTTSDNPAAAAAVYTLFFSDTNLMIIATVVGIVVTIIVIALVLLWRRYRTRSRLTTTTGSSTSCFYSILPLKKPVTISTEEQVRTAMLHNGGNDYIEASPVDGLQQQDTMTLKCHDSIA